MIAALPGSPPGHCYSQGSPCRGGTGAAVKIFLDLRGMPTYPWIYFIDPWTLAVYDIPSSMTRVRRRARVAGAPLI
ncbi:MAG: hypothetical protein JSV86_14270 [Gemmatimonadota bacterium]|nr:MAG: hypothetical protein JSV86_14270 [Gemmatimonadota bacterium]